MWVGLTHQILNIFFNVTRKLLLIETTVMIMDCQAVVKYIDIFVVILSLNIPQIFNV